MQDTAQFDTPIPTGPDAPHASDAEPTPDVPASPDVLTPTEELDKVFATTLNSELWNDLSEGKYNRETAAMLYDTLSKVPGTPIDLITTLDQVNDRLKGSADGTAIVYEEYVLALAKAEVEYAINRNESDKAEAKLDDPVASTEKVLEAIEATIENTTDEDKLKALFQHKRMMEDYLDSAAADDEEDTDDDKELDELRDTAVSTYYQTATNATPDQAVEVAALRDKVEQLRAHVTSEAKRFEEDSLTLELVAKYLDKIPDADDQEPTLDDEPQDPATTQEIIDMKNELAELEKQIGLSYAKREEKAGGFRKKNTENDDLLEEYRDLSRALFKAEHADMLDDPNVSTSEKLEAIDTFMFEQGRKLEDAKLEQDGRGRFKKVITAIGRQMRKHPYLAGITSFGLAAGVGVLTGGAAAGVTAGALAYIRAEDRHQEVKANRKRLFDENGQPGYDEFTGDVDTDTLDEILNERLAANEDKFEDRVKKEKRRRLGSIAIGVGVGGVSFALAHNLIGMDALGSDHAAGSNYVAPEQADIPPIHEIPTPGDIAPTPELPTPGFEYPQGTFTAGSGDGFYDILNNMGVEAWQRDDILARASDELINQGYAYQMPDGMPGIPSVGELPQGAIDILVKAAGR